MILTVITLLSAAIILINGLFLVINRMSRHTRHGIRLAWLFITTGAFGVLLSPIYGSWRPSPWETSLLVGLALCVFFDRRQTCHLRGLP